MMAQPPGQTATNLARVAGIAALARIALLLFPPFREEGVVALIMALAGLGAAFLAMISDSRAHWLVSAVILAGAAASFFPYGTAVPALAALLLVIAVLMPPRAPA